MVFRRCQSISNSFAQYKFMGIQGKPVSLLTATTNRIISISKDSSNKVYLIEKGKVKIGHYTEDGKEVVKAILTKGELFGEKAILGK